ncbi:MAG: hypothetical protein ACLRYC_02190 [Clostridia bacterium]
MIDNFNIMFNEVYSVLNLLGREYIYKLPNNVYEFIKNERVPNYEFNINMEEEQNWYKKLKNIILNFFKNIKDKKNN